MFFYCRCFDTIRKFGFIGYLMMNIFLSNSLLSFLLCIECIKEISSQSHNEMQKRFICVFVYWYKTCTTQILIPVKLSSFCNMPKQKKTFICSGLMVFVFLSILNKYIAVWISAQLKHCQKDYREIRVLSVSYFSDINL